MKLNPNKLGKSLAVGAAVAACVNILFLMLTTHGSEALFNETVFKTIGITLVSSYVLGYVTGYLYNTLK